MFVREQLLCQPVPDPPAERPGRRTRRSPRQTTAREWSLARRAKPVCGACHELIDPIGFGFENFDAIGL